MKDINLSPFKSTWYVMTMLIITLVFVASLSTHLLMTYDKFATTIAKRDYVREVTRWPGHVRVVNIPVEYTLLNIICVIKAHIPLKVLCGSIPQKRTKPIELVFSETQRQVVREDSLSILCKLLQKWAQLPQILSILPRLWPKKQFSSYKDYLKVQSGKSRLI